MQGRVDLTSCWGAWLQQQYGKLLAGLLTGCVLAHAEAFTYLQYEMHCLTAMLVDQEKGFVCPSQGFRRQAFLARSQHGHSGFTQFDIDTRLGGLSRIRSSRPCLTSIASVVRSRVYLVLLE